MGGCMNLVTFIRVGIPFVNTTLVIHYQELELGLLARGED